MSSAIKDETSVDVLTTNRTRSGSVVPNPAPLVIAAGIGVTRGSVVFLRTDGEPFVSLDVFFFESVILTLPIIPWEMLALVS